MRRTRAPRYCAAVHRCRPARAASAHHRRRSRRKEANVREAFRLLVPDAAAPNQLQHRKKRRDDAGAVQPSAQLREKHTAVAPDDGQHVRHLLRHREAVAHDRALVLFGGGERGEKRECELVRNDAIALAQLARGIAAFARIVRGGFGQTNAQLLAGLAIFRIRDEPLTQTLLDHLRRFLTLLREFGRNRGQERPRFEKHERRSHDEVLGRKLHVELLHARDVREVLVGNGCERNGCDVELLLLHEMQQQIERAVEVLQDDVTGALRRRDEAQLAGLSLAGLTYSTVSGSPIASGCASKYSIPRSMSRFSFTYLSAFFAARISNHAASSTSWS